MMTMTGSVTWTSATTTPICREHQLQRPVDQPGLEQQRVHEAVVAEHDDPRIGAHHLAEEQRRDGDDQDHRLRETLRRADQRVGQGIAQISAKKAVRKQIHTVSRITARVERLQQAGEIVERESALERARRSCAGCIAGSLYCSTAAMPPAIAGRRATAPQGGASRRSPDWDGVARRRRVWRRASLVLGFKPVHTGACPRYPPIRKHRVRGTMDPGDKHRDDNRIGPGCHVNS